MSSQAQSTVWTPTPPRDDLAAAGDALRTLAAIQDAVAAVAMLGGAVGTRALAAQVYTHLQGCDPEETRRLAERLDEISESRS